MAVPSHRAGCLTKAYKTRCIYCKKTIWSLRCSCHSKVQFDDLGSPWLKHDCYSTQLEFLKNLEKQKYLGTRLIKTEEIKAKRTIKKKTAKKLPNKISYKSRKKAQKQRIKSIRSVLGM